MTSLLKRAQAKIEAGVGGEIVKSHKEGETTVVDGMKVTEVSVPAEPKQIRAYAVKSLKNRWLCPNGHTLGMILTEKISKKDCKRLIKFPYAFRDDDYLPESIIVSKIDAGLIGCTICGGVRPWRAEDWVLREGQKR